MTFYLFVPSTPPSSDGEGRAGPWGAAARRALRPSCHVIVSFACGLAILPFQNGHLRTSASPPPAARPARLFALGCSWRWQCVLHHNRREFAVFAAWWFPWAAWALAGVCFWRVQPRDPDGPALYQSSRHRRQTLYGLFAFFLLLPPCSVAAQGADPPLPTQLADASIGVISYGITSGTRSGSTALEGGRFQLFNLEFWGYFLAVVVLAIGSAPSATSCGKPALRLKNSIACGAAQRTGRSGVPKSEVLTPGRTCLCRSDGRVCAVNSSAPLMQCGSVRRRPLCRRPALNTRHTKGTDVVLTIRVKPTLVRPTRSGLTDDSPSAAAPRTGALLPPWQGRVHVTEVDDIGSAYETVWRTPSS